MRLILASNNKKKMAELGAILSDMGVEITGQRDAGCDFEVEETGTTFEENARLKAEAVLKATGCAAVADDSGLMVDALNGEPGVYSARYTGTHDATDEERYSFLLKKLGDNKNRSAKFVCCICCMPGDYSLTFRGGSYVGVKVDEWLNAVNEYLNPMKTAIEKEDCQIVYETGSGQFAVTDGSELWASK